MAFEPYVFIYIHYEFKIAWRRLKASTRAAVVTLAAKNEKMAGFVLKIRFWAFLDHLDRCATGATIALGAIFLPIWSISSVRASVPLLNRAFYGAFS